MYRKSIVGFFVFFLFTQFGHTQTIKIDTVLVKKAERKLYLLQQNKVIKTYPISLGNNPVGHKQRQGDSKTPEGMYTIDYRNPHSRFHLSLHINYPNNNDRQRARRRNDSPGGDIFIHGLPNGQQDGFSFWKRGDWTDGCIAVSNKAIKEIWKLVKDGTLIEIQP